MLCIPFFTVFGALSDRIGRKRIMMGSMVLSVLFTYPIFRGMHQAAGNNVVTVSSAKDKVTGAVHLTPLTRDDSGNLVPAQESTHPNRGMLIFLVWTLGLFSCMAYGPIAAYLVEAFPARIRYSAVSLPYHLGNGVFGGMLPVIGVGLCAATGNIYAGLLYPIAVASLTFVVGSVFLKETHGTMIWKEVAPPVFESPIAEISGIS